VLWRMPPSSCCAYFLRHFAAKLSARCLHLNFSFRLNSNKLTIIPKLQIRRLWLAPSLYITTDLSPKSLDTAVQWRSSDASQNPVRRQSPAQATGIKPWCRAFTTRRGRNIRLTAIGQQLAKGLETGFQRLIRPLRTLPRTSEARSPPHQLRVLSVAVRWLIPRLAGFREQFPDYRIDFRYTGALDPGIPTDADIKITWCDGTLTTDRKRSVCFRCDLAGGKARFISRTSRGRLNPRTLARAHGNIPR